MDKAVERLVSTQVSFAVAPHSADLADREASRTAQRLFEHLRRTTKYRDALARSVKWAAIVGSGFQKITWDPNLGPPTRVYKDEQGNNISQPSILEQRELDKLGRFEDVYPGDVKVEVPSIFQMGWDWNAREGGTKDCKFMYQHHSVPFDDLVDRYGSDIASKVAPMEIDSAAQQYEDALSVMTATVGLNLGQSYARQISDRVRLVEWWEVPMAKNGWKGRKIVLAGNYLIEDGDNPYALIGTPLPFIKIDWFQLPGRFIGLPLVGQLREPQKAYNRSRSVSHDIESTHGWPLTILDRRANIQRSKLVSLPGVILEGDFQRSPNPVHHVAPPRLPDFVKENSDRSMGELNAIAANASPTKDKYPAGVRSSLAIQAINEEANAPLHPIAERMADAVAEAGTQMLRLVQSNYDYPRMIQTVGSVGDYEPMWFMGADLRGHTDIEVFGQPVRVETASSHKEQMMAMLELGVLDLSNPAHKAQALKALDARTADEILSDQMQDERMEEKWLQRILTNPSMAHAMTGVENPYPRVAVLERFIKSDDFWVQAQPIQQAIMERWQAWTQRIAANERAKLEAQALMSGSQTAPKGTPSQPKRAMGANT